MTEMDLDLRDSFCESLDHCCKDLLSLGEVAGLPAGHVVAVIIPELLSLAAELAIAVTPMRVGTFTDYCRRIYEAAKEDAET